MPTRILAREPRLAVALEGLVQSRARSKQMPATLLERQPRDRRNKRRDSTKPVAVIATVQAISQGQGIAGVQRAASGLAGGGYYGGDGDFGGGGDPE